MKSFDDYRDKFLKLGSLGIGLLILIPIGIVAFSIASFLFQIFLFIVVLIALAIGGLIIWAKVEQYFNKDKPKTAYKAESNGPTLEASIDKSGKSERINID